MGRETGAIRRRFALASLVVVAFAAFVAAAPASTGTLDQQQTEGGVPVDVFTCTSACGDFPQDYEQYAWAQTFTAGLTGLLDQVDLRLSRHESNTAPLTVEIRTVAADGCPSVTVLASEEIPAADVPTDSFGWVAVSFGDPASVVAGTQYAIVLYTERHYFADGAGGNPYPPGQACFSFTSPPSSPTTWRAPEEFPEHDLAFKTYVLVATPSLGAAALTCQREQATHVGTPGADRIEGTDSADVIVALGGNDKVFAGNGDDLVCGNRGKDLIRGQGGSDDLFGARGRDRLLGGAAADLLVGGAKGDSLFGGGGRDKLRGGSPDAPGKDARDLCRGGAANDKLKNCER